jgi:hypothetical protein
MTTTTTATATATTPDRAEINRRNAQRSTGPRTPEGKNRSKFNALKHGLTAQTLVLPGEDAAALQARLDAWTTDLRPGNVIEQFLIERAATVSWQLDRADRADTARLASIIRTVPVEEARRQEAEAAVLGRRLLPDDYSTLVDKFNPVLTPRPDSPDHPAAIVDQLEATAAGCQVLLDRWARLRALLDQGQDWKWSNRLQALRLLGKATKDAMDDPIVAIVLPPEKRMRKKAAAAALPAIVDRAMARLEDLAREHRERAAAAAAEQAARLSFDPGMEAERLRRYQSSWGRSLLRTLDVLLKIRRAGDRPEPGPVQPDGPRLGPSPSRPVLEWERLFSSPSDPLRDASRDPARTGLASLVDAETATAPGVAPAIEPIEPTDPVPGNDGPAVGEPAVQDPPPPRAPLAAGEADSRTARNEASREAVGTSPRNLRNEPTTVTCRPARSFEEIGSAGRPRAPLAGRRTRSRTLGTRRPRPAQVEPPGAPRLPSSR